MQKNCKFHSKDKTILFATDNNLGRYLKQKIKYKMEIWKDYT